MEQLSLDEIKDHKQFEELIVSYFEDLKKDNGDVDIKLSGTGTDGGRDILVTFQVDDSIVSFKRIWVIQCKFRENDISTKEINDINIPSLIHSYKASGYVLVCKKRATSKLTDLFERLEEKCTFGYKYRVWTGEQLIRLILSRNEKLWQQFFPKFYDYSIKSQKTPL